MTIQDPSLLDISNEATIPYFMWDYHYTVGRIKEVLSGNNEEQRIWLMAKILRDARYCDVWKFISLKDFLRYRERLMLRLGRQKAFWQFLYSRWIKYGIVGDGENSESAVQS